jgi:circadian clock protein KaiC
MADAPMPGHLPDGERPRISTGSPDLDEILGGGLDPERVYLYEGAPGTGKTTLAIQFLLEGAVHGERGLYITLSETERETRLVTHRHGWSLDGITIFELVPPETTLDPDQELTVLHPGEMELTETTKLIVDQVETLIPARVVIDSLSELRLLAQSPLRYRRQVLALKHFFAARNCTVVVLDDLTSKDTEQLHSMVHGVVLLEQLAIAYGSVRRRLRVLKMRGIDFSSGFHDFEIRRGGLKVFPRLIAAEHHVPFPGEFVSSGNVELDTMLGGGLERGTNVLFVGPTGVGKSSLALTYALAAAGLGHKAAIFAFDEGRGTMDARAHTLGLPLKAAVDDGLIQIRRIDPAAVSPGELVFMVRRAIEIDGARIVVIDSLNGYLNAAPEENFLILQMHELLSYLNQLGVLTILVLSQHSQDGLLQTPLDISYLSDAVVSLRYFEAEGGIRRAIAVVKKRSGNHQNTVREYRLSGHGITIGSPLKGFGGFTLGLPSYTGPSTLLAPDGPDDF